MRPATRSQKNVLLAVGIPYKQVEEMSFSKAWQIIAEHRKEQKKFIESRGFKYREGVKRI